MKSGTDVGILTNGVLIKEKDISSLMENLTYMRFSVSGGSHESYSFIHGCHPHDWDKVRNNMRKCADYRNKNNSKCTLGAYTLISDKNINEIEDWVKEVKNMGFDYITIKPPAPGLNHVIYVKQSELDRCKPIFDGISKMSDNHFKVEIRKDLFEKKGSCERDYGKCLGLPFMCAIDSDGSVYSCNWFWGNKDFCYGNINENTFRISVTSFLDGYNFDMKSIKKECVHVLTPDLKRIPFSAYNMFYRKAQGVGND